MKTQIKSALTAAMLAATLLGTSAWAQSAPATTTATTAPQGDHHGWMARKMEQRWEHHMADLKAHLKLSADQEAAWNIYKDGVKPPPHDPAMMRHQDFAALSTPERLDKMHDLHQAHAAEWDRRASVIKTFYGTLSPDQKKVYDDQAMRHCHEHHEGGHWR